MLSKTLPSSARAGRAIGAMFFAFFGAVWLVAGSVRSGRGTPTLLGAIILCAIIIVAIAYRRYKAHSIARHAEAESPAAKRRSRWFNIINAAQWIAILIAVNVLIRLHLAAWSVPACIFIVGLHFLPLARLFAYLPHYVTGVALMLVAVVYPFAVPFGPQSSIGCLCSGIILWISALYGLTL